MTNQLAAGTIQFGHLQGFGPLGNPTDSGINTFSNFISSTVGLMTIIAIIWFVFTFMIGAIGIISAGGDKQALESSRKKIITGIIGLTVVIVALFVIQLIGTLLGIDILNLPALFNQILIK